MWSAARASGRLMASTGAAQRDVALTTEAMALDLQAVVDQLALESFFVFAPFGQAVSCDV